MKGVLLVNLGSPDSTSVGDVRRYLNEFLMDSRVIDTPWLLRRFIVGLILISRPKESAHAYEKVWTKEGSPLVVTSRHVQELLQKRVSVPVELAMRYQNPSIESAVKKLAGKDTTGVLLIPLFPHYAMSSYHLLFSFHGIPERHIKKSDPTGCHCLATPDCCETPSPAHATCYRAQCFKTAALFTEKAGVPAGKWSVSFQSRLGKDPWLKPYTDYELPRLATEGKKRMLVICPAFVSDCLETIEEIGIRGCEQFMAGNGREFTRIPCMNEHPAWIAALEKMVNDF